MRIKAQLLIWKLVKLYFCVCKWAAPHLSVLAKGHSPGLHVQHTGDVVSLCVAGQREGLLSIMVEVAAVCTVEPHVGCGAVVEIMHWPAWHTYTRSLISTILLHDIELKIIIHTLILTQLDTMHILCYWLPWSCVCKHTLPFKKLGQWRLKKKYNLIKHGCIKFIKSDSKDLWHWRVRLAAEKSAVP